MAYVTGAADASGLRDRLRVDLPEYMVPAAIVPLEAMPLNPSGKVDRGALAKRGIDWTEGLEREFVAPRTALEIELADLFRSALGVETVGVQDNFFELGGNSITGAILINRLQQRLGEIVHVVAIFDAPTVEGLAGFLVESYPEAVERLWARSRCRAGSRARSAASRSTSKSSARCWSLCRRWSWQARTRRRCSCCRRRARARRCCA